MQRFDDIDQETRADWRNDPTTEAFIRTVVDERTAGVNRLVELVKDPKSDPARFEHVGGKLAVIDDLLAMVNAK